MSTKTEWPPKKLVESERDRSFLAYARPVPRPLSHFRMGRFPPHTDGFPHRHPCIVLHGCVEGPMTLILDRTPVAMDTGVFYVLPKNVGHCWHNAGGHSAAAMGLYIDTDEPGRWPADSGVAQCCRDLGRLVRQPERFNVARDPQLQNAFWQAIDYLTSDQRTNVAAAVGNLWLLLGLIVDRLQPGESHGDMQDGLANQIRRLLLARVVDQLTIEEIAKELSVSPTRAKAAFKRTYGCGIKAYFNQLKIWQAKRLLCDSTLTIDQISRRLGFASPGYFSRMFLASTGQSPSEFRDGM